MEGAASFDNNLAFNNQTLNANIMNKKPHMFSSGKEGKSTVKWKVW